MDNDHIIESGLSRREMLIGAGILAGGYGVGQLLTGASAAHAVPPLADFDTGTAFPWPSWDEAQLEAAAREAAIRGADRFRAGGGCANASYTALVSVLADEFGSESLWHCLMGGPYSLGSGEPPNRSFASWGIAGLANWGATCGIVIGCSQFTELAVARGSVGGLLDKIYAYFCEGEHPFNEEWFVTGKAHPRDPELVDFSVKYGSLQCHNIVMIHLNEADFTDCGFGDVRGEFCSTLVGAMCYETMKQIGTVRGGFEAIPATPFSNVRAGCSVTGCHSAPPPGGSGDPSRQMPSGFLPKENCFACHK